MLPPGATEPLPKRARAIILIAQRARAGRLPGASAGGGLIPLFSPIRQNEAYFQAMEADFARILRSGTYVLGPEVGAFEEELASRCGYRFAVGCSRGTEALTLSLKALELPHNAEVITSSFSFVASASTILWAAHRPVLANVSPETGCLRLEDVA